LVGVQSKLIHSQIVQRNKLLVNVAVVGLLSEFVGSNDQLVDMLTKSLRVPQIEFICSMFGIYNLYAPT